MVPTCKENGGDRRRRASSRTHREGQRNESGVAKDVACPSPTHEETRTANTQQDGHPFQASFKYYLTQDALRENV